MADFFEDIRRLQGDINRSFRGMFGKRKEWGGIDEDVFKTPLIDLRETNTMLIAVFEIPGVERKDINLNITETNIEIRVVKKHQSRIEKEDVLKQERTYRGFYRSMSLPCEVLPQKSEAKYENGILRVIMPKTKNSKKSPKKSPIRIR